MDLRAVAAVMEVVVEDLPEYCLKRGFLQWKKSPLILDILFVNSDVASI
jgi:hypothetical protein